MKKRLPNSHKLRILGIDPSLKSTGYGIIEYHQDKYEVIAHGIIKPAPNQRLEHQLHEIKNRIEELIETFQPTEAAIENLFYARNIKTAITLGQVRGVVLVAVAASNCHLFEYSPLEIKKAVTGYGQADKYQVQQMIRTLLNLEEEKLETDASDALATALCHVNSRVFQQKLSQ